MPAADVVVAGAGLAGLTAAIALADAGATVEVVAAGHAATHWTAGGIDVAAPAGAATAAEGLARLAHNTGHPYAILAGDLPAALTFVRTVLAAEGLDYVGGLDDPLRPVPTAIGGTRPVSILPAAQAAALTPWRAGERLIVCGPAGFKDFWPAAIAASLGRPRPWGAPGDQGGGGVAPARVEAVTVEWPGLAGRRNLNALELARRFDDPAWRAEAFEIVARAVGRGGGGPARIALPAVLGLREHRAVLHDAEQLLPFAFFEVPLVPPSVPGLRLYGALRSALLRRGGRMAVGEAVARVDVERRRVIAVATAAAVRERTTRTGAFVLATGGIAGGGLIGTPDGKLLEPLLGLPVEAPPADAWLAPGLPGRGGHPLEIAGIRTDGELRPVDAAGRRGLDNVAVAGSLLAGQRYLSERCGDGVAIASGWRAATRFGPRPARRAGNARRAASRPAAETARA